jgi:hypothetical protein
VSVRPSGRSPVLAGPITLLGLRRAAKRSETPAKGFGHRAPARTTAASADEIASLPIHRLGGYGAVVDTVGRKRQ